MSRSVNQLTLVGNVGNDPEVRSTTGGNRVATFSLATSRQWNDASGNKQEKTEWHRCVVWGKLADIVEKYVSKGSKLYASGRVEYRQWQDKDGQTRYTTEINVNEVVLLGGGRDANGGGHDREEQRGGNAGNTGRGGGMGRLAERAKHQEPDPAKKKGGLFDEDFEDFPGALADEDDDLPF